MLKVKAVENVLLKCQTREQNPEGLQVYALLDEVKRSKSNLSRLPVQKLPSTNIRKNIASSTRLPKVTNSRATMFNNTP